MFEESLSHSICVTTNLCSGFFKPQLLLPPLPVIPEGFSAVEALGILLPEKL